MEWIYRVSLNGVVRGGAYNNSSDRCICAGHRRNTYTRSTANSAVGFRLNGVIRGGGYSSQDTANFRVDGIRINSYQLYRGMSHIGFRTV